MNLIEGTIMSMFDIIEYIIISKKLIHNSKSASSKENKVLLGICVIAFAISISLSSKLLEDGYNVIMNPMITMFMTYLLYKRKMKEVIYIYGISSIIILTIQLSSINLISIFTNVAGYTFNNGLISHIITLGVVLIINKYLSLHTVFNYVNKDNKTFKILILNMFVVLVSVLLYWYVDVDEIFKGLIMTAILSIGIILVNFVLLKNGLKNELEEEQLKIYKEYLPVIDELISELRKKQHEFDNHIQALNMLTITSKDYDSIVGSMKEYIEDLTMEDKLRDLIKIDNKILAGFLYNKIKSAEKLGVKFEINIKEYNFNTKLRDYELVEIMGNLINNAFETEVPDNEVVLVLTKEKDMNVIEIRNKHPYLNKQIIDKIFNKGFSTKSYDNRGYGLYNLSQIVKKYNGHIEVLNKSYNDKNYILFRILFIRY